MTHYHSLIQSDISVSDFFFRRDECREEVNGYSGARYKKFGSAREAEAFVDGYDQSSYQGTCEPPHDKTNKMTVRPAKTQISLGIHPV